MGGASLVTCLGSTFPGVSRQVCCEPRPLRIDRGLLAEYEELALKLAQDRELLASFKARLARNRDACALFNSERFARHIEAAYAAMWNAQRGEAPESFAIASI